MPINKITHVCLTHDKVRARPSKDAMRKHLLTATIWQL